MTPEESERLRSVCREIAQEQDQNRLADLLRQLYEIMPATPELKKSA